MFDKCVLHLNQKTDEKLQSNVANVKEVAVQTENVVPDDDKAEQYDSSYHGSPSSPWFHGFHGSPEINEKKSTIVTDKEVENKQETLKIPDSKIESRVVKSKKTSSPKKKIWYQKNLSFFLRAIPQFVQEDINIC